MALFVLIGIDGPRGPELRNRFRADHLAHLDSLDAKGRIAFAGPVRDEEDRASVGAVIVIEAANLEEARRLVEADPFVAGGVFEKVTVAPFKRVYPRA